MLNHCCLLFILSAESKLPKVERTGSEHCTIAKLVWFFRFLCRAHGKSTNNVAKEQVLSLAGVCTLA